MKKIKTFIILSLLFSTINFGQIAGGTYTIGSGETITTITQAVDLIENFGIDGNVIFNILNGTYNEQIDITGPFTGSSTYSITFQSSGNNPNNVIITHTPTGSTDNFLIKIDNVQLLIFRNLTLTLGGTDAGNVVFSDNIKGNINFDGNIIDRSATVGELIKLSGTNLSSGHKLEGIVFNDNIFNGGSVALSLYGAYDGVSSPSGSVLINGNTFTNSASAIIINEASLLSSVDITGNSFSGDNGISYSDGSTFEPGATFNISDNTFTNSNNAINISFGGFTNILSNTINGKVRLTDCLGLQILTSNTIEIQSIGNALYINNCDAANIKKNKIRSENDLGNGMYVQTSEGGTIRNNFVQAGFVGLDISVYNLSPVSSGYIYVDNNSVNIETSIPSNNVTSSALLLSFTDQFINADYYIRNNILINKRAGYAYKKIGDGTAINGNYNNFFTNGTNIINYNGSDFSTFALFQFASSQEANSYNSNVFFTSYRDLHLISSPITLTGTNVSLTDDIDGDARPNPPYLGADEPLFVSVDLSLIIMLEGPFNGSTMNTLINSSLPLTQPYSAPIHSGTESVASGFFSTHPKIVDWIVVELRKDIDTKGVTKAGFLLSEGAIFD